MSEPEMVERVARAILKARFYVGDEELYDGLDDFFAGLDADLMEEARFQARAAIEAMQDASFDVLDAGVCHEVTAFRDYPAQAQVTLEHAHVSGQHINGLFNAMIDAALSTGDMSK